MVAKRKDAPSLGERVTKLREKQDLRQYELAELAKVNPGMLSQIESDKRPPTLAALRKISQVLGVSVDYFLNEKSAPTPGGVTATEMMRVGKHLMRQAKGKP